MKKIILASLLASAALPASAAVIYLDLDNLVIPNDVEGVYINIVTGDTAFAFPGDFNEAPWINLFLGGTGISNSELLRPWASQTPDVYDPEVAGNYFLNVAPGTTINSSGVFVNGESASALHVGGDSNQFQSGVQGYLAFAYEANVGGGTSYGWLSITPSSSGPGVSVELAYSDIPGEALLVAVIPEPSTFAVLTGALMLGAGAMRRRRAA